MLLLRMPVTSLAVLQRSAYCSSRLLMAACLRKLISASCAGSGTFRRFPACSCCSRDSYTSADIWHGPPCCSDCPLEEVQGLPIECTVRDAFHITLIYGTLYDPPFLHQLQNLLYLLAPAACDI